MIRARLLRGATVVGILVALVTAAACDSDKTSDEPAESPVNYVALGDSYSAGVGAGNYLADSGDCSRSPAAFPALWAAKHKPKSFTSVACSGAEIGDIAGQLSALSPATTLVSVTVGGNDIGFGRLVRTCILESQTRCVGSLTDSQKSIRDSMPGRLDEVYRSIRQRAPGAMVVVLGYPRFYEVTKPGCDALPLASRTKVNETIDQLDEIIAATAARNGFRYADVRDGFSRDQICTAGTAMLHALTLAEVTESYHPTAEGQSDAYLPAFTAAAD